MHSSKNFSLKQLGGISLCLLILSMSLFVSQRKRRLDPLTEIRVWALQQNLWPQLLKESQKTPLIAVRQVYEVDQQGLKLSAYLLVPCVELCGSSPGCERTCQQYIQHWSGHSSQAHMMIEAYDQKHQESFGRLILDEVAPLKLRYWSYKHKLLALIQSRSETDQLLHLIHVKARQFQFKAEDMESTVAGDLAHEKKASEQDINRFYLEYYDHLELGPHHGLEAPLEGSVSFRDLNGDGQVDLLAPFEGLVHVKPNTWFLPTPYEMTDQGLKLAPNMIQLSPPQTDDLRSWLLSLRGSDDEALKDSHIKSTLSFGLLLCLKGECDYGEELMYYAYPQQRNIHQIWAQLRQYVEKSKIQKSSKNTNPYLQLDL